MKSLLADKTTYVGVCCKKCNEPILFGVARSTMDPEAPAKLLLTCARPECRHQADYSAAAISRYTKNDSGAIVASSARAHA